MRAFAPAGAIPSDDRSVSHAIPPRRWSILRRLVKISESVERRIERMGLSLLGQNESPKTATNAMTMTASVTTFTPLRLPLRCSELRAVGFR
jgi:hypothetical protein